jgi:hypothetical protein
MNGGDSSTQSGYSMQLIQADHRKAPTASAQSQRGSFLLRVFRFIPLGLSRSLIDIHVVFRGAGVPSGVRRQVGIQQRLDEDLDARAQMA